MLKYMIGMNTFELIQNSNQRIHFFWNYIELYSKHIFLDICNCKKNSNIECTSQQFWLRVWMVYQRINILYI